MLGQRIAALRRDAGMSQAALAGKLQVSASAVGMYEQGRREPDGETLVQLAQIFGVSTDYLLTGSCRDPGEQSVVDRMLLGRLEAVQQHLEQRQDRPFSRAERAVLFAAMLMEP